MSSEKDKTVAIIVLLAVIPAIIFRSFVMVILWEWFIVPIGAIKVEMAHMVGISSMVHCFCGSSDSNDGDDGADVLGKMLGTCFLTPLLALLIGRATHWIMMS